MKNMTSMSGGFAGYSSLTFFKKKVNQVISGTAIGGNITQFNDYNIHTFASSGTFEILTDQLIVESLIVGGGGGALALSGANGGGGAGGVVYKSSLTMLKGQYVITIGDGGQYVLYPTSLKTGGNSSITYNSTPILIAYGGGSGVNVSSAVAAGGSGAGASYTSTPSQRIGSSALQPSSLYGGFGNKGNDAGNIGNTYFGGGGGGAGTVNVLMNGGDGIKNPIVGSTVGELISGEYWIAGGGGGAGDTGFVFGGGSGKGGGGAGSGSSTTATTGSNDGLPNTGGGAGAGPRRPVTSRPVPGDRWNYGGSGVVIFRYYSPEFASGGILSKSADGFNTHRFTTSGVFKVKKSDLTVEVLIVAGGGGGGIGGGGGAGGALYYSQVMFTNQEDYTITVGAGGLGTFNSTNGGNSSIVSSTVNLVALGGGAGSPVPPYTLLTEINGTPLYTMNTGFKGNAGGSGGGGGGNYSSNGFRPISGGAGTPGQGNKGGDGYEVSNSPAGGGGGAGGAALNVSDNNNVASDGGIGLADSQIGGLLTSSGMGQIVNGVRFIAGGGGGGSYKAGMGGGGAGGGGAGGTLSYPGNPGLANTGGGGGGSNNTTGQVGNSGAGGSGVVIIRYRNY
jgi:hypothetical protein